MTLSEYLTKNGMRASEFARLIGSPASTVTRLLSGKRKPGLDLVCRIQKATNGKVLAQDLYKEFVQMASNPVEAA